MGLAQTTGTGTAVAGAKDVKSLSGLCTNDSASEYQMSVGLCQALDEQFKKKGSCVADMLEQIRQQNLPTSMKSDAQRAAEAKDGYKKTNLGLSCSSKDGSKTIYDLAKDPNGFAAFMSQFMMVVGILESNNDVGNKEQAGAKGPGGILNLNIGGSANTDMENKAYACGCKDKVVTTSGQSNVSFSGVSPGPLDGPHSETCGACMVMTLALQDGRLYGGNSKVNLSDSKKDGRLGATKLFKSLEDDESPESRKRQEFIREKMKTYCEHYWNSPTGTIHEWTDCTKDGSCQQRKPENGTSTGQ